MNEQPPLTGLKTFLRVYGVISVVLFGGLFALTMTDAAILQEGGALRFMRWEPLAKHIELMLEGVYFVWAIFFLRLSITRCDISPSSTLRCGPTPCMG